MERDFICRYQKLMNSILFDGEIPKISFSEDEYNSFVHVIRDFYNLVIYDKSYIMHNQKVLKDAFLRREFLVDKFLPNTEKFKDKYQNNVEFRNFVDSEDVERLVTKEDALDECIKYVKFGNGILVKDKLDRANIVEKQIIANTSLDNLQKNAKYPTHMDEDNKLVFELDEGMIAKAEQKGSHVVVNFYDNKFNPFDRTHFKLFCQNGEVNSFEKTDFVQLYKNLRTAEAHHHMYNFGGSEPFSGKVFVFNNNKNAIAITNRMQKKLYKLTKGPYLGYANELKFMFIPRDEQVRYYSDIEKIKESASQKLKSCKLVSVSDKYGQNLLDIFDMREYMHQILEEYAAFINPKTKLEDYILQKLQDFGIKNVNIKIEELPNIEILKTRISNKDYCQLDPNGKKNITAQNFVLRQIVEDVYGYDIISEKSITKGGKFMPISIDMKDFYDYLNLDCKFIYQLLTNTKGIKANYSQFAKQERYVCYCMFLAYNALIRNNYLDKINEFELSGVKEFEDRDAVRSKLKSELVNENMNMFTMINNKGETTPKDLASKITVLRAVRNAISHNALKIKYTKTGNIQDATFVFQLQNSKDEIRVNTKDFENFITSPIFFEYVEPRAKEIKANSREEIINATVNMCKLKTAIKDPEEFE